MADAMTFLRASVAAKLFSGFVIGLFFAFNHLHYYYDRQGRWCCALKRRSGRAALNIPVTPEKMKSGNERPSATDVSAARLGQAGGCAARGYGPTIHPTRTRPPCAILDADKAATGSRQPAAEALAGVVAARRIGVAVCDEHAFGQREQQPTQVRLPWRARRDACPYVRADDVPTQAGLPLRQRGALRVAMGVRKARAVIDTMAAAYREIPKTRAASRAGAGTRRDWGSHPRRLSHRVPGPRPRDRRAHGIRRAQAAAGGCRRRRVTARCHGACSTTGRICAAFTATGCACGGSRGTPKHCARSSESAGSTRRTTRGCGH